MNRDLVANLSVLALIVVAAVALAVRAEWEWWQVLLAAVGAFFGGGLVVERLAPGTRALEALGWYSSR